MGILKDKTCPKCGKEDALCICPHTFAVNCSNCYEFIRILTREERLKMIEELWKLKL